MLKLAAYGAVSLMLVYSRQYLIDRGLLRGEVGKLERDRGERDEAVGIARADLDQAFVVDAHDFCGGIAIGCSISRDRSARGLSFGRTSAATRCAA